MLALMKKITIENIYRASTGSCIIMPIPLKYDFEVLPGADPSMIKMQIPDAGSLRVTDENNFRFHLTRHHYRQQIILLWKRNKRNGLLLHSNSIKIYSFNTKNTTTINADHWSGTGMVHLLWRWRGRWEIRWFYLCNRIYFQRNRNGECRNDHYLGGPLDAWIGKILTAQEIVYGAQLLVITEQIFAPIQHQFLLPIYIHTNFIHTMRSKIFMVQTLMRF